MERVGEVTLGRLKNMFSYMHTQCSNGSSSKL